VVALLGANGAGKTTTIRAITGLLAIHDGRVREGEIHLFSARASSGKSPHAPGRPWHRSGSRRAVACSGHLTVEENLPAVGAFGRQESTT